jgi:phage FluMu gp28-like protein
MASPQPAIKLYDYQKRWLADAARFKHGRWSRQTGKSFIATLGAVDDCFARRTEWLFLSRGERQSKKLVAEAKKHALAYSLAAEVIESDYKEADTVYKMLELRFPNGSAIYGLPANPDTARGWSANVFLDEFAFHKDSRAIWTALYPTITRGYKLCVLSTPNGKNNKFFELESNERFSKHVVTIYDAVAGGLDLRDEDGQVITADQLMEAMGDREAAEQEYLCLYIDEATAFISYDLITEAEDPDLEVSPAWAVRIVAQAEAAYAATKAGRESEGDAALATATAAFLDVRIDHPLYIGMDIGRKRDLTVIWIDAKKERRTHAVAVIELRRTPFYTQLFILSVLLAHAQVRRCCGDQSGLGLNLMESAALKFGAKVEGVDFTSAHKEKLATDLKTSLEDHRRVLPAERIIRESIHSVRRYATGTGHFRFDAERTDEIGHADHFWAAALAEQAASGPMGTPAYEGFRDEQRPSTFAQEGTW